ncbi:MAG: hypothetical protein RBU30_09120 [Polyangia bacterium]|jgi:hypothetical protein|nr:hypothetical protein [Polyangia bacterium]
MPSSVSPETCEFCGRRAELSLQPFDAILPMGPPRFLCRFCLGRPHRQAAVTSGAATVRLEELSSGRTAAGQPEEVSALLAALAQQRGERTITAAIRLQSQAGAPTELVCAGCGGAITPSKGGMVAWQRGPDGGFLEARLFHGQACAALQGAPPSPGCWEDLDQLGGLDLMRFDEDSLGYLTDVELAWRDARSGDLSNPGPLK